MPEREAEIETVDETERETETGSATGIETVIAWWIGSGTRSERLAGDGNVNIWYDPKRNAEPAATPT